MPKKEKDALPDISKMSLTEIVDELGDIRFRLNNLKRLEGYLKEALTARADPGEEYTGSHWRGIVTLESRMGLDSAAVKAEMGEEWWVDHCKETEFYKTSVVPID